MASLEVMPDFRCFDGFVESAAAGCIMAAAANGRVSKTGVALVLVGCIVVGLVQGTALKSFVWGCLALLIQVIQSSYGSHATHAVVKLPLFITWVCSGGNRQIAMTLTSLYASQGDAMACLGIWSSLFVPSASGHVLPVTALLADGIPSAFFHAASKLTPVGSPTRSRIANACRLFSYATLIATSMTHSVITPSSISFLLGLVTLSSHIHTLVIKKKYSVDSLIEGASLSSPE
ncbi:hypothetical protein DIPPA_31961 [Diplonema papillatum]|nr:hypothetical protein DIPPA_30531 [Diplonema papillatum]KAJ9442805.1 hypothetical protein DIPPA_31961 [Diplonema papillatum]|eukprot:gene9383-14549_t